MQHDRAFALEHRVRTAPPTHARAFTLIEGAVVIAIIAIVAAIAVPRYGQSLDRYRLDAAVDRLVRDIELARRSADGRSQPCWIGFNDSSMSYDLYCGTSTSSLVTHVDLWHDPYQVSLLKSNFGGGNEMDFNGFGVVAMGGTVTLQSGGNSVQVIINSQGTPTEGTKFAVSVINMNPQTLSAVADPFGP